MDVEGVVYKININGDKYYVGSSKNYDKRWKEHLNDLKTNQHHCTPLQSSYDKHKQAYFTIIHKGKIDDCREIEDLILKVDFDNLFNLSTSAYSPSTEYLHSKIHRELASKRFVGKYKKPTTSSEETKRKMALTRKGTTMPKKCIDRSVEVLSKPIIQYDLDMNFICEYKSVTEAGKQFHENGQKNISKALSGAQKTAYKFIWKYKEKEKIIKNTFSKRYINLFLTRYNTVSVKIRVNGEIFFLGTYDTQKEALEVRNRFVINNNLIDKVGLIEYEGE